MRTYITLALIFTIAGSLLMSNNSALALSDSARYNSGYDHGCSDAGQGGNPYLVRKGGAESHTAIFMTGYYDGYRDCSGTIPNPSTQTSGINWENLCNQYGGFVGITSPCSEFADGTVLTQKGQTVLVCLFGGAITLVATLDPVTKAAIYQAGDIFCPK